MSNTRIISFVSINESQLQYTVQYCEYESEYIDSRGID